MDKLCCDCSKPFTTKKQIRCPTCQYNKQWRRRHDKVYTIVGTACWKCGYDKGLKGTPVLDFHHMDPTQKLFHITRREIATLRWDSVWAEMQKCTLICCRCHREFHAGLLGDDLQNIHKTKWEQILGCIV